MSKSRIEVLLEEVKAMGFDQADRHEVGNVFHTAWKEYVLRHPHGLDAHDMAGRRAYHGVVEMHAECVARQYIRAEIDKAQRRGYRSQADGHS